ncbi:LuxR C-terminal-related transcriptional regulator [Alteribacillus sp. JSM 102045]|uniref:LuxR C-terminal-related transcriptional regulator n=1 Tax=Alteribacillus sp. JSM 102045 TaxID=1562101 RepID=UPI0035C23456
MPEEKRHGFLYAYIREGHEQREKENFLHRLTKREIEVLRKITEECSNKEISSALVITEKTVVAGICRKCKRPNTGPVYALKHHT